MKELIKNIIANDSIHARWLNTLSLMENTGARKISASEHPILVSELVLKHAAEEARHAYFLKKQISKIPGTACIDFSLDNLLGGMCSYHYLQNLDIYTSRYANEVLKLKGDQLRKACYLLVTFAIEVRADELYPIYQNQLDATGHTVNVKSIIAEEAGHLEEMVKQLESFSAEWQIHADIICAHEQKLFAEWKKAIQKELNLIVEDERTLIGN
ncbi:MAG TPA: hypothetical protein PKM97_01110 [Bacteroidia bacterium]|nr:hypothetical protein [Bacteroidia bacterium]